MEYFSVKTKNTITIIFLENQITVIKETQMILSKQMLP